MKTEKFSLKIKDNSSGGYKNIYYDDSNILTDYKKIYAQISKIVQSNSHELQSKNISILLEHPTKDGTETITIKNIDEWNFLYNYNIINECINKNKLKINHKDSKLTEKDNLINIIKYIMQEKIPKSFYFNSLINFINNKNYLEEFKLFFLNELFNSDSNTIKGKDKKYNILIDKNITNKKEVNKDIPKTEINEIKDIQIPETKDFVNIFNTNYINSLKYLDSLNKIKTIIDDNNDANDTNEENATIPRNKTMITIDNYHDNYHDNYENCSDNSDNDENQKNRTTLNFEKKNNLLLLEKEIEEKKYLDNNKNFKKLNKIEYYIGLDDFKDKLYRQFYDLDKNYY